MSAIVKLSERFTETSNGDEIVVMQVNSGKFLALTGTAAATWLLIDGTRDRDSLIGALADKYGVEETTITADVDEFLGELRDSGLLGDG